MIRRHFVLWVDAATKQTVEQEISSVTADWLRYQDTTTLGLKLLGQKHTDPDRVPPKPFLYRLSDKAWEADWHAGRAAVVSRDYEDDGKTLQGVPLLMFLLMLLLSFVMPPWGMPLLMGAVAVHGTSTTTCTSTSHSSLTFSRTIGAGSDLVLVVTPAWGAGTAQVVSTSTPPTFNSDALTQFDTNYNGNVQRTDCWYRVSPDVATANVVVTYDGNVARSQAGAVAFNGADQTTPLGTAAKAASTTDAPTVTVLNVAADDFVFDVMSFGNATPTVGASQTEQWQGSCSVNGRGIGSTQDGADGGVMSHSLTASVVTALMGVRVIAASAGGGCTPTLTLLGVGRCVVLLPFFNLLEWLRRRKNAIR